MNLEKEYKATMVGLHKYMMNKEDPQIKSCLKTSDCQGSSLNTQGS